MTEIRHPRRTLPQMGDMLEVEVHGIDDEGRGRGVVFTGHHAVDVAVRGALPGDVVQARVERVFAARALLQARALTVARHGPLHVERACPHQAPCPGCPLEGTDEGFRWAVKRERIVRALIDNDLGTHAHHIDDVMPTRGPRQKVKLAVGGRPGALRCGLFVPHSHVLVGAELCPHQHPRITEALEVLRDALNTTGLPPSSIDPSGIKAVILRVFREGVGAVVVTGAPMSDGHWQILNSCVHDQALASCAVRVDTSGGNSVVGGIISRAAGPQHLSPLGRDDGAVPPEAVDAFCQTDPELADWLYMQVAQFLTQPSAHSASPATPRRFADLYAGTGGFARALQAHGAQSIIAVERATTSAQPLSTLSVERLCLAVEEALPLLHARGPFVGIVVDPPKQGLQAAAAGVAKLGAQRLALVACDPDAGARDARVLVDAGYVIERITPVDLFPATPDVETVFFLSQQPPDGPM